MMNEKVGIFGAIGAAVVASICCIGPVVLAGLGIGAVSAAQLFAPLRPYFLALTAIFLGLGFYFAYRQPKQAAECDGQVCERPSAARWRRLLLWIAAVIVLALVTFPYYYAPLRTALDKPRQTPAVAFAPAQPSTVVLKVSGMTCEGCAVGVRTALLETPRVVSASVDFKAGRATVQYDPSKASTTQLIEAVSKAGFKATL
jgi:mercuric ion transport protein